MKRLYKDTLFQFNIQYCVTLNISMTTITSFNFKFSVMYWIFLLNFKKFIIDVKIVFDF